MVKILNILRNKCEICSSKQFQDIIIGKYILNRLKSTNLNVTNKEYSTTIELIKCQKCSLIQPKYLLNSKQLVQLYNNIQDSSYLLTSDIRGKSNYEQIIPIINKYIKNINKRNIFLLEIGSGSGGLLNKLAKKDINVIGLEPSKNFCRYAENKYKNIFIHNIGFEYFNTQKRFDIIIALDIIEHVASPYLFMLKINKLLKKNGILIIGTPNINSLISKLMGKYWWHIRPPHIFYFNNKNLIKLANLSGMKLLQKNYFYWNLSLNYLLDSLQKLIFKKSLFSFIQLDKILIKINFFDSILYTFRKKIK